MFLYANATHAHQRESMARCGLFQITYLFLLVFLMKSKYLHLCLILMSDLFSGTATQSNKLFHEQVLGELTLDRIDLMILQMQREINMN